MEGFSTAALNNFEKTIHAPFAPEGTTGTRLIIAPGATSHVARWHDISLRTPANCPNPAPVRYLSIGQSPFYQFDAPTIWEDGGPGSESGWCATDRFTTWAVVAGG